MLSLYVDAFKSTQSREEENVVSLDKDRRENQPAQDEPSRALQPGTPAPDFTLHSTPDQTVSLSEFRGQPVILAFYPADWSPACGAPMAPYTDVPPESHRSAAAPIGTPAHAPFRPLPSPHPPPPPLP